MKQQSLLPSPAEYQVLDKPTVLPQISFTKEVRKNEFDRQIKIEIEKPGPADYSRKRMFDNKQIVDYSQRKGLQSHKSEAVLQNFAKDEQVNKTIPNSLT